MSKYKNESEFWKAVKELYNELITKQMPDLQQGSALYTFVLKLQENMTLGSHFLIPNTLEYYALSDYSVAIEKRDDRERFLEDMRNVSSVFLFLSENSRSYINPNAGLFWRRVYLFKENKEVDEYKQKNN